VAKVQGEGQQRLAGARNRRSEQVAGICGLGLHNQTRWETGSINYRLLIGDQTKVAAERLQRS
jgi:hypothetical protein